MSFDVDPKGEVLTEQCPQCEHGIVKEEPDDYWRCDTCNFEAKAQG